MLVHYRANPGIKFAGTHLYTGWREALRVKCLTQEHDTTSPPYQGSNPETSALTIWPPRVQLITFFFKFGLPIILHKDQKLAELGVLGLAEKRGVPYFFCLAREFWNHTCVTLLLRPVSCAIRSRSCPSGFESMLKLACRIWSCSSVNVVRTRLVLWHFRIPPLEGESSLSASNQRTKTNVRHSTWQPSCTGKDLGQRRTTGNDDVFLLR